MQQLAGIGVLDPKPAGAGGERLVVTAVALGALALGTTGLKASGLQNKDAFRSTQESVLGERALDRHFPGGAGKPVQVIGNAGTSRALRSAVAATPGITQVTRPVVKGGRAYLEGTLSSRRPATTAPWSCHWCCW